jgi:hypothetical protein
MSKVAVSVIMTVLIVGILIFLVATELRPAVNTKATNLNFTIRNTQVDTSNGSVTAPAP